MMLYKRIDNMTWREFDATPNAICADFENRAEESYFFDYARDEELRIVQCECALVPAPCECALVPAPQAERHAALGRAVAEAIGQWPPARLREAAQEERSWAISHRDLAAKVFDAIAAWMEVAG